EISRGQEERRHAESARLSQGLQQVYEAQQKKEWHRPKEAVKAAPKKPKPKQDDDDDDRMPRWKKGVLVVAGLLVLYWTASAAYALSTSIGRPSAPRTAPVAGRVLFEDGQPVTDGTVWFHAQEAPFRNASGVIGKDGSFKLTSFAPNDGAPAGRYKVV